MSLQPSDPARSGPARSNPAPSVRGALNAAPADTAAVICTGRLYCDMIMSGLPDLPQAGQEIYADSLSFAAGGGAYITAAYLAACGRGAALAAIWPADPFAVMLDTELDDSAIALHLMGSPAPGIDPQLTVAIVTGDDRAFLTRRAGPAVPETLGAALESRDWQHLHIGELATLAEAPWIVPAAKAAGMTVSCDCAWDADLLARDDLPALLSGVDVFLPNRVEADALTRHAPLTDHAALVVVKDGASGAVAHRTGAAPLRRPACAGRVVDTVGAGDAFNAGFIDAWLAGVPLADCLDAGAHTAAAALARTGGARDLLAITPLRRKHVDAAE
ncbi:carbohydrate kinase family protein [Roseicitreum antarcticum]|uniref:Sugar or nucleoside kinase, ribokinase family n=1 Tax=Roseicitreum antarcticum TaxID=564137 RepID=A0A1H2XR03_9RHOB|nr:PfkB family carbohydrate kinase [Roseicitreum antarcticum]SDW95332.1 Sugar or nucleoside kinase, ribokinase family [Roseicitreum antarcticum]